MLIAITGQKFSGKDTLAKFFLNREFQIGRFAEPLKEMLRAMYRYASLNPVEIERKIEGDMKEIPCPLLDGKTPREAMQTLGTEWRNLISKRLWLVQWEYRVKHCENVVVPDLRFLHEANMIREHNGHIIKIERPGVKLNGFSSHTSEVELARIVPDYTIINDGTISQLHEKAKEIFDDLRKGN